MSKFLDETGLSQLWEKIKLRFLDSTTKYASSPTVAGPANKAISIPFGIVDSTSTATAFTATVDGIPMYNAETSPTLADGTCVYLSNPVVTSAAKSTAPKCWTLNINGYGAKPVYVTTAAATYSTTHFTKNYKMLFIYDDSLNSGNGGWYIGQLFNSNTTYSDMTQAEINAGTGTTGRKITPKMLRDNFYTEDEVDGLLDGKQDTINDLVDIRSGAALGATAIQPTDIKDELDPGGNGEIADSAAIAEYVGGITSDLVQSVVVSQTASGNDPGTTITIDDGTPHSIVKDNEPGGSSNASVAPSWGAMKTLLGGKVDSVELVKHKTDESDESYDTCQTDLFVDDISLGTIVATAKPVTSQRPYIAPSWQSFEKKLSEKSDKSNTYTKSEVDSLVSGINNNVIIGELPSSGQLQNRIYRVPGTNSYTDWAWDGSDWVKLAEFSGSIFMHVTEAQYDALSDSEKNNGTWYFIEEE